MGSTQAVANMCCSVNCWFHGDGAHAWHVQVNYDEKGSKGKDDASDYSAQSEESADDDSDGEQASFGKPPFKASRLLPCVHSHMSYCIIFGL